MELLISVAIISLLSSIALASLSGVRQEAKITGMAQNLKEIEKGLKLWMQDNNRTNWPQEYGTRLEDFINNYNIGSYLPKAPKPAFGSTRYTYQYAGDNFECGSSNYYDGVVFYVRGVPKKIGKQLNEKVEDDTNSDGTQDLECGKFRRRPNGLINYQLSPDGSF